MNRKMAISAAVGIAVLIIALLAFGASRPIAPPAVVGLIGFTNSASGGRIGRFQIHNQSALQIARNGYCRLDGRVVDIPPTKTLEPGDTEIVELPLDSRPGGTVEVVRFNGVRDFMSLELAISNVEDWLKKQGWNAAWLDTAERRRWEVGLEFRRDTPLLTPNGGKSLQRPPKTSP
jgi:hypothetical protein